MVTRVAITKPQPFPIILKYTEIRSYVFTLVFLSLSVLVPWAFHQFHLAGPTLLPMHVFVLLAGLLFGWRAGLVIGFLAPLASYVISGMPVLAILPQITVELSTYGLLAGLLREKYNLRVFWSLLGAMLGGRMALFFSLILVYLLSGVNYSPLGVEANPITALWSALKLGWPGMAVQLVSIPAVVWLLGKLTSNKSDFCR